jgi:hypothetical protein
MAMHKGICGLCNEEKEIGLIACLKIEACLDCFKQWQNNIERIKKAKLN